MSVEKELERIYRAYQRDPAFSVLRDSANFVPGVGPLDARVMVIGEAPGRHEDVARQPFVGRAGNVLTRMLEEVAGIPREKCFITNVLKYRPPANRDPELEEVAASRRYVGQEVTLIEPDVIVLAGRFSLNLVFPQAVISQAHGVAQMHRDRLYLPVYHPAVTLYNPLMVSDLRSDFLALRKILES